MDADAALPASLLLAGVACLLAPRGGCRPVTTNEALPLWACCHHRAGGGGSSGNEAVSLMVCSVNWSVLTVNIIPLHGLHGCPQLIISSSYT